MLGKNECSSNRNATCRNEEERVGLGPLYAELFCTLLSMSAAGLMCSEAMQRGLSALKADGVKKKVQP